MPRWLLIVEIEGEKVEKVTLSRMARRLFEGDMLVNLYISERRL